VTGAAQYLVQFFPLLHFLLNIYVQGILLFPLEITIKANQLSPSRYIAKLTLTAEASSYNSIYAEKRNGAFIQRVHVQAG